MNEFAIALWFVILIAAISTLIASLIVGNLLLIRITIGVIIFSIITLLGFKDSEEKK